MSDDELRAMALNLASLFRSLDEQMPDLPPSLRVQATKVRNWAKEVLEALGAKDGPAIEDLMARAARFDAWIRDLSAFEQLVRSGAVQEDAERGRVTLRWDLVAREHRKAAVSFATELVDAYRGRSVGGRPKKERPEN